jgi:hypothetical protein
MTNPPPTVDPVPKLPGGVINDDRFQANSWQSGYQLGRYDQRITDLQETQAWLSEFHDEAMDVGYHARQGQLEQLQADLLEAENARARYLENLGDFTEEWDFHRLVPNVDSAADLFEGGDPSISNDQPSAGQADNTPRLGGVVRTPRTPDSLHQAYRSQGPVSTFRPRI